MRSAPYGPASRQPDGCPSAALLDEIGGCTDGVLVIVDDIAARLAPDDPRSARVKTLSVFAMMVGTLQLSRALAEQQLADQASKKASRTLSCSWAPSIRADLASQGPSVARTALPRGGPMKASQTSSFKLSVARDTASHNHGADGDVTSLQLRCQIILGYAQDGCKGRFSPVIPRRTDA